ncbi:MAG: CBASS cGAMP-activated phospholipase [Bradyrhizobium sp.]|nr:CBASS cGAMP-activated phospholipase [Bradyrhizobium sp.]
MFRILSLDGGGIKGAFTASVLTAIEKEIGQPVGDYFDLIAGTSTGGILALGLGFRIPAETIRDFYRDMGPDIFPATGRLGIAGFLRQLFGPKHSHAKLRAGLENVLGNRKFGAAKNRMVIPTYDAIGGRIFILKTAHHARFKFDIDALAVDVALATSAAPTYFEAAPFPVHVGSSFVDGGVWANNPMLVAIIEATCFLGVPLHEIDLLSIGTTSAPFNIANNRDAGILKWNVGMINLMFEAQAETALKQAKLLLNDRVVRIDVMTKPGEFSLDDASPDKIDRLMSLGRGEAVKKANLDTMKQRFFSAKAPEFVPVHAVR